MASAPINRAQLHPLVLMSITDIITRHVSRGLTTPLVGGLMGQQTKDGITVEHNFDILLKPSTDGKLWHVDSVFFNDRLRQLQEVHKEPVQLEFVGLWTLSPSGINIDETLRKELGSILPELVKANEAPIVLAMHTDLLVAQMSGETPSQDANAGVSRMPFTVYEPVQVEPQVPSMDGVTNEQASVPQSFREIPWEMQTGEAEMIALEFVKTGAGNATRVRTGAKRAESSSEESKAAPASSDQKSQAGSAPKSVPTSSQKRNAADLYTPEEEEMLSFLNTRANAMRTLLARLSVIRDYVGAAKDDPEAASPEIMRAIKALLSGLPGVEAAKKEQLGQFDQAQQKPAEKTPLSGLDQSARQEAVLKDAALIELLGSLGRSVQSARELGGRFQVIDSAKKESRRKEGMMTGAPSMEGRFNDMEMMDLT